MNEITIVASIMAKKGNFSLPKFGGQFQVTMTGTGGGVPGMMSAATVGTNMDLSDLTTVGWVFIANIDTTHFVTWGPKVGGTFYPIGKLLPGEWCLFRLDPTVVTSTTNLHIKADTAAAKVQVVALEA